MSAQTETRSGESYKQRFDEIDRKVASVMDRWEIPALRVSIAIVFIWFGGLKVLGISPAADLVAATVVG